MKVTATELRTLVAKQACGYDYGSNVRRLYSCSAKMIYCDGIIVLKSYYTYVAHYDMDTKEVYVYGSYSTTTSQHISKFVNYIKERYGWACTIYLYVRSDKMVLNDRYGCTYMIFKKGEDLLMRESTRRELNRDLVKHYIDSDWKDLCTLPASCEDDFLPMSANWQERQKMINMYYGYTRW